MSCGFNPIDANDEETKVTRSQCKDRDFSSTKKFEFRLRVLFIPPALHLRMTVRLLVIRIQPKSDSLTYKPSCQICIYLYTEQ